MFFTGTDAFEEGASSLLAPRIKSGGAGKVHLEVYASSGASLGVQIMYNHATTYEGYHVVTATVVASVNAMFGYCGAGIASGCTGWAQIRGAVDDAQCAAAIMSGSIGHTVRLAASGMWSTSTATGQSAFTGGPSQVAVLRETFASDESTTANIWLVGNLSSEV